jgi:hypothetical protein
MRTIGMIATGLVLVLLLVPFAAAAPAALPGSEAEDHRPAVLVEHGSGLNAGLVKVKHIHYVKPANPAKPVNTAKVCYKLAGYSWNSPVRYTIQTSEPSLAAPVAGASGTWDAATGTDRFYTADAAGTYIPWNEASPDSWNLVTYGDYGTGGIIAVTITWYDTLTRKAVESDILFNNPFAWGDAMQNPEVMDLENIATHEIGHTLGLSDLYTKPCSTVTMFGYSTEGETSKRTLEPSDIAGLRAIYGA